MTKHNQQIGKWGEDQAAQHLLSNGYQIIARNIRTPYGEIDLIASLKDITIFIEVKTLTASKNFYPEQNVTARKREHMLACAEHYAAEHEIDHWQIDVIAIEGAPQKTATLTHFENAVS